MEVEKKKEGSPSIKLGLGIDGNTAEKPVMKHGKLVLTTAQLHELQLQALIYKYLAGGIAVPFHLVMPIWESVASSGSSSNHGGIYQHYPSFIGISPQEFYYRSMMDIEPGRCRRTDGKKWRCSKNVIPDQKYCEQHMHRGRQRSRKLVESSQSTLPDTKSTKNSNKESENLQILSVPLSFQCIKRSACNTSTSVEATAATDSNNICSNRNSISGNPIPSTVVNTGPNNSKKSYCKRYKNIPSTSEKDETKLSISVNNVIKGSSNSRKSGSVGCSVFPGVGFSPNSVLQVLGCSSSHVCKNDIEVEPGRCRRTDGKKWRCSRDVIPDQKYCARHMHRGAKKHGEVSQPAATPSSGSTIANKATFAALDTSLSISIPSPQLTIHDGKSMSSSSETTISDTNINVVENGNFS